MGLLDELRIALSILLLQVFSGCAGSPEALVEPRAELERQTAALDQRLQALANLTVPPLSSVPSIEAIVVEVREKTCVVLYFGKQSGVRAGSTFDVFRGSVYKGLVRVTDVREATCSGVVVHEANSIVEGDTAICGL